MKIENLDIKKQFYKILDERQRRLYTAQLALDLGHGSIKVISSSFDIEPKTIWSGIQELKNQRKLPPNRIREEGGGRKKRVIYNGNTLKKIGYSSYVMEVVQMIVDTISSNKICII